MYKLYERMIKCIQDKANKSTNKKILFFLKVFIVFITVYVLILPAFSIEKSNIEQIGLKNEDEITEESIPIEGVIQDTKEKNKLNTENQESNNTPINKTNSSLSVDIPFNIDNKEKNLEIRQENNKNFVINNSPKNILEEVLNGNSLYLDGILKYSANNYIVEVEIGSDAKLPKDTKLEVSEIKDSDFIFQEYKERALEKVEKSENEIKSVDLLDIGLYSQGEPVQPQAPVKVEINYNKSFKEHDEDIKVVHFKEDGSLEVLKSKDDPETKNSDSDLAFKTNSFSIYAIVKDDITVYRHTYIFENHDGTPYKFKTNVDGETDRQIIKDGESLHGVGTPIIKSGQHFNGWFIYNKDTGTFGNEVVIERPMEVKEDKIIYVRPDFGNVVYATFYDSADATQILERKAVSLDEGEGRLNLTEINPPISDSTQVFVGWSLEKNGDVITENLENYPITEDITFYPIFKQAKKIQFNTGNVGQGATYIAPKMVVEGETAQKVKPQDPTKPGYTFGGWYTKPDGQGEKYNFTETVTTDITLYAKWIPAKATYTIVYWKQSKGDNKNATDSEKTYDYAGQISREGNVGETVSLSTADKKAETGFEYTNKKGETQIEVKADGSSVINVYFNRKLITMKFYKNKVGTPPSYYNRNWDNDNYAYTYTGLYGTSLEENGYKWPSAGGSRWMYYTKATNKGMSYLGEFILPDDVKVSNEIRLYKSGEAKVNYYFYKQNLDGTYNEDPTDTGYGSIGTFTFSEKYRGFKVSWYRRYDTTYYYAWYDLEWARAAVDGTTYTGNQIGWNEYPLDIYIRYERQKFNINFLDPLNDKKVNGVDSSEVIYEDNISKYIPDSTKIPNPSLPGYKWDGKWYKDKNLTEEFVWNGKMPDHDLKVYAGFRKESYKITIDPNGGQLNDGESTYFNVNYGEKIIEYKDITRNYVENSDGTFYYRYDTRESDPSGERKAFYTEDSSQPNIKQNTKYKYEKDAYKLIGWYYVNPNGTTRPYNFNGVVVGDTTLRAIWRRVGDYKLKYDETIYDYNAVMNNEEDKELKDEDGNQVLATDLPIDGNKYDDQSHAILPSRPHTGSKYRFRGWYYDGKIYNPYDEITIDAKFADKDKVITIYPVFKAINDLKVETTKLIYDGNGGRRQENNQSVDKVEITKKDGEDILVNTSMITEKDDYFTRTGYDLIGWNDSKEEADNGIAKFTFEQEIGIDNKENNENVLYAVWEPKTFTVTVTKKVVGNELDKTRTFTFTPGGSLPSTNFALKDGETKTFEDIPYDSEITIDEQDYPKFDVNEEVTQKNRPSGEADKTFEVTGEGKEKLKIDGDVDIVFTNTRKEQDISIQKVDIGNTETALQGAEFKLYDGSKTELRSDIVSNENGYLNLFNLKAGNYELVETKAPDGYQLEKDPIKISVTSTGVSVIQGGNAREVTTENKEESSQLIFVTKVTNSKGIELPNTGGVGDDRFIIYGLALIIPATVLLYKKRKNYLFKKGKI